MKVEIKKVCLAVFCIWALAICAEVIAGTEVRDPIDVNTVWDVNGSPYCLKSKIPIRKGATLTIKPGVKVGTDAYSWTIEVLDGSLIANGVEHVPCSYNYYVGIEVPNGEGFVHLSDCNGFGRVEFYDGSSGTVENSTINYVIITGDGGPTLSDNSIGYIDFPAPAGDPPATITGNTFTNEVPLWIADPDLDTSGINDNDYEPDSIVRIWGILDNDKTLGCIDNGQLCKYRIFRDFEVTPGATLTIEPRLELEAEHSTWELLVKGSLVARGDALNKITFSRWLQTLVYSGGFITLSHCNVTGWIDWHDGSSGTVENSTINYVIIQGAGTRKMFDNTVGYVELWDDAMAGCMADNFITESGPFRIINGIGDTSGICDNIYDGNDPNILISGSFNNDCTVGFIDSMGNYRIFRDFTVAPGAAVTFARDTRFEAESTFYELHVRGSIAANGVMFSTNVMILVKDGGLAKLWHCDMNDANSFIDCQTGSSGILEYCRLNQLYIDSEASFSIVNNDFSLGSVTAEGEPNAIIDMDDNWWGTTDANEIEEKILDCNDDPENRPCVDYEPFLQEPPPGPPNGGAGDFEPDGDVEMSDLAYFVEHWLESNCGCSNWCSGADLDQSWFVDFADFAILADNWLAGI